jgi:hypothetical protein
MLLLRKVDVSHRSRLRMSAAKAAALRGHTNIHKVLESSEVLEKAHDALLKAITLSDVGWVSPRVFVVGVRGRHPLSR